MITKEQAEAASELLLQEGRLAQAAQAAKLAHRRRVLLSSKWVGIGVMLGYSLDELISHQFVGQASAWVILSVAITLAIVTAKELRRA